MITFQKQFGGKIFEFKFFCEQSPAEADDLSLTGCFSNSIMQSIKLVAKADMENPWNKAIKLQESRNMIARLIKMSRKAG